ncbi:S-layer homology domain-containing protein [Paenibacillus sp. 1_12]|uniref:S-layer homology domain-containing protein n=1 Tax=Paenibacillus sp. 1_12 TaxID=1566278 RepID=UPI000AB6A572|nr:S-layer homology domain-containing protein [Paenibacillus sp. 1_12]
MFITDSIPQWARAEVAAAHKQGIINGRDNNLFAPNDSATRAEAVTLILALQNKLQK